MAKQVFKERACCALKSLSLLSGYWKTLKYIFIPSFSLFFAEKKYLCGNLFCAIFSGKWHSIQGKEKSSDIFNQLFQLFYQWRFHNGMLRHSLETLEGEQDFIFFYRALLSWESPFSLWWHQMVSFTSKTQQSYYSI